MAFVSIDFRPPPKVLRNFGLIGLVAFSALAALVHWKIGVFGRMPPSATTPTLYVLLGLAGYSGFFALVAPPALRWLYIGLSVVAFPIGFVISYIVVSIMFYLIITPIGLVFKLIGRDALRLQRDPQAQTYWIRRTPPATIKRYFRQF
jgi:hypothetical protein